VRINAWQSAIVAAEQVDQPLFDIGRARQSNALYRDVQDVRRDLCAEGPSRCA
jgi:hypothetical protein